jgi:multicomponent Na+:H+ antiporter subunit G
VTWLVDGLSWSFLLAGGFLSISGGVGVLRFPDFFCRLHATGVTDTLCAVFMLVGLMMQAGWGLVSVKLAFIMLFLLLTSPTATHALLQAALQDGLKPLLHKEEDKSKS